MIVLLTEDHEIFKGIENLEILVFQLLIFKKKNNDNKIRLYPKKLVYLDMSSSFGKVNEN
jgi:hypothetical protein